MRHQAIYNRREQELYLGLRASLKRTLVKRNFSLVYLEDRFGLPRKDIERLMRGHYGHLGLRLSTIVRLLQMVERNPHVWEPLARRLLIACRDFHSRQI